MAPASPGLGSAKDFFYLPMNRRHRQGIGYAFINFQETGTAALFKEARLPSSDDISAKDQGMQELQ